MVNVVNTGNITNVKLGQPTQKLYVKKTFINRVVCNRAG